MESYQFKYNDENCPKCNSLGRIKKTFGFFQLLECTNADCNITWCFLSNFENTKFSRNKIYYFQDMLIPVNLSNEIFLNNLKRKNFIQFYKSHKSLETKNIKRISMINNLNNGKIKRI